MKEFKFCGEITEYVEIPVTVHGTQKELLSDISLLIRDVKDIGMGEEESIYIIYKDGSKYFAHDGEETGKFKRYGIKSAVYEHVNGYVVFGDFAVTDNGDISIEENDIEEYGVYAGQYDVKEQTEETVESVEVAEETTTSETETVETESKPTTDAENDKTIKEYQTIHNRCNVDGGAKYIAFEKCYKENGSRAPPERSMSDS